MAEETPPPQLGSFTDSEGGEGRHLVQWLRGSLSAERGARKAAQRSVASLEARLASLERQLQGQRPARSPAKSRLRKSSVGEPDDGRMGANETRPRGNETAGTSGAQEWQERLSPRRSPGRSAGGRRAGEVFEGMSLESAAWRAWQTFSAEMARIAEEREARQSALERKVDGLAKQVDSLLPANPPAAFPGHGSLATSSGRWDPVSIAPDYHDVPGTSRESRGSRSAETSNGSGSKLGRNRNEGSWKLTIPGQRNDFFAAEREESPTERAHVDSLAIWGGFPSVSGAEARPPKEFADSLSASGSLALSRSGGARATHLRTSSEGDAPLWNGDRKTESDSEHGGDVKDAAVGGTPSGTREEEHIEAAEETGIVPSSNPELQHGALYSPLEDDTVWESLMYGGPQDPASVQEPDGLESHDYEEVLAKIQGHLDNRMLGFERYGGGAIPEVDGILDGFGGAPQTEAATRPPQMPYVTLPNTPLHEAAGLRSQLSRSDSGASSDFR
ncbi:hypothetical protein KFL_003300110 [Klebsormidium nitens]|uniref:Uncharacterized protein n=1 Tax=Klebsormidium nitens TaxID=105231 RepID=A0A1Y1IEE9_KLENI|nr:hypothetical protein KFL_003300110 [Klebsormidium nitens]|eukprot:GAQ87087.1 hypothetical protein KFL_003300110 [Klebsormidium nitens]